MELEHHRRLYASPPRTKPFPNATRLTPDTPGFLSESWHITSRGMFAGSCIGVICLVLCLELLRRVGREYDAFIVRRARLRAQYLVLSPESTKPAAASSSSTDANYDAGGGGLQATLAGPAGQTGKMQYTPVRPTLVEQTVRASLHMLQFAVAYFVMLLAMYFNGYIIICIFIGAFLGSFIFSWEPLQLGKEYVPMCPFFLPFFLPFGMLMLLGMMQPL